MTKKFTKKEIAKFLANKAKTILAEIAYLHSMGLHMEANELEESLPFLENEDDND